MKTKKLIIVGAGSLGIMTMDIVLSNKDYNLANIYFIDDSKEKNEMILGVKVLGGLDILDSLEIDDYDVIIAIANNQIRKNIASKYDLNYVNLIHKDATVSDFAKLGKGNIILPNVSIDPLAIIENHVIINKNTSVGHNVTMKNYSQACPGCKLGGIIGEAVFLGLGSIVLPNIKIGENTIVGAGAVVNKELPSNCTAVGMPAKIIK